MLSEAYGVNAAGIWEERTRAYPWRSCRGRRQEGYSNRITHSDNARRDAGVNCKKSAEAIVPEKKKNREGPNSSSLRNKGRCDGAERAENCENRLVV